MSPAMTDHRPVHPTTWGPTLLGDGTVRFRLWAPDIDHLSLRTPAGDLAMNAAGQGWFELVTDAVPVGGGYGFVLPGGLMVPDPAARAQVGDVHGLSRLVDPAGYPFRTPWQGRPWHEAVVYELHLGTFTSEGTFAAAAERLGHLADLGVTAVELMPVAQFAGRHGWGYDGVLLYAPHNAYGTPDDFKRFVDIAHGHGLMVLLDVVYNHFGPDGNYLGQYASAFFDAGRHTPWGSAIAFDKPHVRAFFIDNPLMWLTEYNLDGLRFDAIDHVRDESPEPILEEMARRIRETFDRPIHLCTEDERNIVALHPYEDGRPTRFTAEWNDDFHNMIHAIATGENEGYYADFAADRTVRLARALAEGFIFQGEPSKSHGGAPRGVPSAGQPPTAFVIFNQNHDQIGNRAFGERLIDLAEHDMVVMLTAMLLLSPQIPLLYMGEEWGETNPFSFFCDFDGELAGLVREGRRNEFAKFDAFRASVSREEIPDPNDPATFTASRIDWARPRSEAGATWLALYRRLLALRAAEVVPHLADAGADWGKVLRAEEGILAVRWRLGGGAVLEMTANLTAEDPAEMVPGRLIAAVAGGRLIEEARLGPHGLVLTRVDA
ncbi:MAG: malto-oligosyltrehalose trehalohydrolase [Acuticoccus sp.]